MFLWTNCYSIRYNKAIKRKEELFIEEKQKNSFSRAKYDASYKRILSEKKILAWILKGCVEEFRDVEVSEIANRFIEGSPEVSEVPLIPDEEVPTRIRGVGTEDKRIAEGTITYDIRFHAFAPTTGEPVRLILNVEAQGDYYPGYPLIKRAIYYGSRLISSEFETEFTKSHYEKIKKVYSIWICLNPPKSRRNTITRYGLKEKNVVGAVKEPTQNYDLLKIVMICLGESEENEEGNSVLKLLDSIFYEESHSEETDKILQEEFGITVATDREGEESMYDFSEAMLARGWEKGHEKGLTEGILGSIRSLMNTMKWTEEESMTALQIPKEERQEYLELLQSTPQETD